MRLILRTSHSFCKTPKGKSNAQLNAPFFAKLENRAIIVVHGPDAKKLLQGVTTNNINSLYDSKDKTSSQPKVSMYTLFLNPKGKIITDAIISRPRLFENGKKIFPDDQLWIDVSKSTSSSLFEHLRKYTWKKRVELLNLEHQDDQPLIFAGFNQMMPASMEETEQYLAKPGRLIEIQQNYKAKSQQAQEGGHSNIAFYDPRDIRLGMRMYCAPEGFDFKGKHGKSTEKQFDKICLLHGLSSSSAMVNKLPFMFNSDIFNGFSFNKGCYLGQQIVSRAYFTGIIRRRVFPYVLNDLTTKLQQGQMLMGENKVEIGKVLESHQGFGTVLCNYLPFLQKPWPLQIQEPVKGIVRMPFGSLLKKYILDIKAKQARLQEIDL